MGVILGVFLHFIGGFASGSFYIPYKKVKGWNWESYWLADGFFHGLLHPFWLAIFYYLTFGASLAVYQTLPFSGLIL